MKSDRFDRNQLALVEAAQAYNLAGKLNGQEWSDYLRHLEALDANVELIKVHALAVCYSGALKEVKKRKSEEPAPVAAPKEISRYRSKLAVKLAKCESLDDYINSGVE